MNLRRTLLFNSWIQLGLVVLIVVLTNVVASRHFLRLDLTSEKIYTLSDASRVLMGKLDKPLFVKVYFTRALEAPYNNHEQVLVDKLEEFRAYSRGRMEIATVDPTGDKDLEAEAQRFGIRPIQYRYQGKDRSELKRVFMGATFVYGDKQTALEAVTQVDTLEYDIAHALRSLVETQSKKTVGFTSGSQEVDLLKGTGPLENLRTKLQESYDVVQVPLGGEEGVPANVDALLVLGPQTQMGERAKYQLDQFLMRGGSLAVFVTNLKPDLRTFRPEEIFTGLESFLGHYGVVVNRDLVVDRNQNGVMRFPVRQGRYMVQLPVNYPLIPRSTDLSKESLIVKGLDQMLFPFASSLNVADPLPAGVEATVLARASAAAGRLKQIRTIDPSGYKATLPNEETGPWPLMVALTGPFTSYFAGRPIPPPAAETPFGSAALPPEEAAARINESAAARLLVSGSADAFANNPAFVLNLVDWMCQDEALIGIRAKSIQLPPLEAPSGRTLVWIKLVDALSGVVLLFLVGGVRWFTRRRGDAAKEVA
jgi:gliding-associated putative ABC transporter substrate-binding component GldG